jgi:hypothetical protein
MASEHRTAEAIRALLDGRLPDPARTWFTRTAAELDVHFEAANFFAALAAASRRLGRDAVEGRERSGELRFRRWTLDELGRAALLLQAVSALPTSGGEELVSECFFRGDNRERQAVLSALPLLPEPRRFLSIALEACRSSVQPVFEAIACENPYPSGHFPQPSYNQMVLKAVFTGVALGRIVGLEDRLDRELARMAADYAQERRAAGRSIPAELDLLMTCAGGEREAL